MNTFERNTQEDNETHEDNIKFKSKKAKGDKKRVYRSERQRKRNF